MICHLILDIPYLFFKYLELFIWFGIRLKIHDADIKWFFSCNCQTTVVEAENYHYGGTVEVPTSDVKERESSCFPGVFPCNTIYDDIEMTDKSNHNIVDDDENLVDDDENLVDKEDALV